MILLFSVFSYCDFNIFGRRMEAEAQGSEKAVDGKEIVL